MISTSNLNEAKKQIQKDKHPIIVESQDPEFDRKILEYGKFDILLSPEKNGKRDKPKQLDSGLNHVLANIATKNKIAIGINLEEISKLDKKGKAIRLARIKQNLKLVRKAKTKFAIIQNSDKKNARNLLLSLGASTQQTKETITF